MDWAHEDAGQASFQPTMSKQTTDVIIDSCENSLKKNMNFFMYIFFTFSRKKRTVCKRMRVPLYLLQDCREFAAQKQTKEKVCRVIL